MQEAYMMRSKICYLPVIILSFLLLLQTAIVSAADHPIFQPLTGYSAATDEKGPGTASFARSSGNDIDVQGEKTVIRYELNSGAKQPGVSEIIKKYSKIASDRKGWTYLYTDHTLYMGFTEQGGREYFAEVYVGDEYYDLIVVERGASGTATTGVTAQQTSNASQIQQAGTSGLSTQHGTINQAQSPDVAAADTSQKDNAISGLSTSSSEPQGLAVGQSGGAQGAGGQSSTGGGSNITASIQIVSPEPNVILFAGDQTNVRWTSTGVGSIEIGYVSAAGFQSLARNVPAANGFYRITIPSTLNSRNNSYVLKVRSASPPNIPESSVSVRIHPHIDLVMYPVAVINQRDYTGHNMTQKFHYYTSVARLTMVFINNGIDELSELRAQIQFINQDTEQLVLQGEIAVTGTFIPALPYTVEPLLCICRDSIRVIQPQEPAALDDKAGCSCGNDQQGGGAADNDEMGSTGSDNNQKLLAGGNYRIHIKLLNPLEPVGLQNDNTKILIINWHTPGNFRESIL
jgi:hypothetical protein